MRNQFIYNWNHILLIIGDSIGVTKGKRQFLESYSHSFPKENRQTNKGELISGLPGYKHWVKQKMKQESLNDLIKTLWSQSYRARESGLKKQSLSCRQPEGKGGRWAKSTGAN